VKNNIIIESLKISEIPEAANLLSRAFILTPFSFKFAGGQSERHRRMLEIGFIHCDSDETMVRGK